MRSKRGPGRSLALASLVVVSLIAAACGDKKSDQKSDRGSPSTSAAPVNKAKGKPIVIGIYTPADNTTFTAPELIDGADAAVQYVNNDLGGIGGRPIKLEKCKSDYTAPGLTACANKLFQKDPLIIIPGPDAAAFVVQPTFDKTGIPLIGGASFTPPEYTSPNRVMFNGFSASLFPAMVHFAVSELKAKKLATLSIDDPTNPIIKSAFVDPIAKANGLPKPTYVASPRGSADLTSTFAAALGSHPSALLPFGVPCLPAFQAYKSLGTDVPMIMPDNCADKKTLAKAGSSADGVYFVELYNGVEVAPSDPDVKVYTQKMAQYGNGVVDTDFTRAAFGTIMNIHNLLKDKDPNSLTHQSVLAAFRATTERPNFLNTPYGCKSPPVAPYPAICAGSAFLVRQMNGKLERQAQFVTMDDLYKGN